MNKIHKKTLFIFFCCFALFFGVFYSVSGLEVDYPVLSTGAGITPQTPLPDYLKYVFDFGIFIGFFAIFLSLVWAGVLYLMSPAKPDLLATARDRVSGAISGLLILALLYLIITTINPELRFFRMDPLEPVPPPPEQKTYGVYFYKDSTCSESDSQAHRASITNLGLLKNKINSINIVNSRSAQGENYIAVIYDVVNYWGKCQYINPNKGCKPVKPFAASASIYQYNYEPDGDGVYFYRKSFFNDRGGYLRVGNDEIEGIYIAALDQLSFTDSGKCTVPEEEQDCVMWNSKKECLEKKCPTLGGENISSIKINGDYFILLIYLNVKENSDISPEEGQINPDGGPWNFCQAFPAFDDVNREGPQQIKWESIRNNNGKIPNFVMIFPVKNK